MDVPAEAGGAPAEPLGLPGRPTDGVRKVMARKRDFDALDPVSQDFDLIPLGVDRMAHLDREQLQSPQRFLGAVGHRSPLQPRLRRIRATRNKMTASSWVRKASTHRAAGLLGAAVGLFCGLAGVRSA